MAKGFKMADFFAQLSIKADTKEVEKIEKALQRINQSLGKIKVAGGKTAKATSKIFEGEHLKSKQQALIRQVDALKKLGGAAKDYGAKIKKATSADDFLKIKNQIGAATIAQRRLNVEIAKSTRLAKEAAAKANLEATTARVKPAVSDRKPFVGPTQPKHLQPFKSGEFIKSKEGIDRLFGQTPAAKKAIEGFTRSLEKNKVASREASLQIRHFAKEQRNLVNESNKSTKAIKRLNASGMQLAQSLFGAFAVFEGVKSINTVGQDFEGMEAAMLASSGSAVAAKEDLAFVDKEVVRLGLDLRDTTDAFSKLQFAARGKMTKSETRGLFVGFSEFAQSMKVAPEQAKSGMRALQQMLNKTTIMS